MRRLLKLLDKKSPIQGNRELGGCGYAARTPRASAPRALWGFGGDGSSDRVGAEGSTASV